MPPKRKTTRPAQGQPQPAQSDYDTDFNFTDQAASMAPPPQRTNTELNLTVLRRYSPGVERIVSIAPFAAVYLFSPETEIWDKCNIEGTLFVNELSGEAYPRYNIVVLNRKSMDNFITELYSPDDIEVTDQYIILQVTGDDGVTQIFGVWIYGDSEQDLAIRNLVAATITECATRAQQGRDHYEQQPASAERSFGLDGAAHAQPEQQITPAQPQPTGQPVDLLHLFGQKTTPQPPQPQAQPHQNFAQQAQPQQAFDQQPRFHSTSDTNFFRSSSSPAMQQPYQQTPPPMPQQHPMQHQQQQMQQPMQQQQQYQQQQQQPMQASSLLDLFKK